MRTSCPVPPPTSRFIGPRLRLALILGPAAILAGALTSGCGWTPRDDFYDRRELSGRAASQGDGSRLTWSDPRPQRFPTAVLPGGQVAQAPEFDR